MRDLAEIKKELDEKLKNGHPGNLQVQLTDKILLHCADCNNDNVTQNYCLLLTEAKLPGFESRLLHKSKNNE